MSSKLWLCVPLVVALQSHVAQAWAIGSQINTTGCHEPITAQALRNVRATLDAAPVLTPSRDEAAMIADVLFAPPNDFVGDLAGMTLLLGVRDNDLKGVDPLSSLDLIQVHGSPTTQDEHCIRGPADDDAAGNASALAACRMFIRQTAAEALDGLDAEGKVDPTIRTPLSLYVGVRGQIKPSLPLFYVRMGAAMHALEDGFAHTYRTADGMNVTVVLNWIDYVNGPYNEAHDGPPHRAELDRCWDSDPTIHRNYDLATQAATELLTVALDPTLGRDDKIERFDAVTAKYLGFEPGCTFDNHWCDPPEAAVTNSALGCNASGASTLLWTALAVLGVVIGWRRRSALVIVAALAIPARADDPPPTTEPGRDVKTPTAGEVAKVREAKKLGNPWGFAGSFGGAVDRPALATSLGGRYRLNEQWLVGLDAGWNPWITTSPMNIRAGVATLSGALIRRFPMKFDRVNLRTSLHAGVSTLLFDVYGAPKYSIGPYVALSPLGIDYDLGNAVRIVFDPMEMALPMPLVGQLPLYYEQFRAMIGIQVGS